MYVDCVGQIESGWRGVMWDEEIIPGAYCPFCNSEAVVEDELGFLCTDCLNLFDDYGKDPVDVFGEGS